MSPTTIASPQARPSRRRVTAARGGALATTAVLTALALAGCGSAVQPVSPTVSSGAPTPVSPKGTVASPGGQVISGTYVTTGTVYETADKAAFLCLGATLESYPPQCGGSGITLAGWDWSAVDDEESASGTTWGYYTLTGTYDGTTFTPTKPPAAPEASGPIDDDRLLTPCAPPAGGWGVVDAAKTTDEAISAVGELGSTYRGWGTLWVDTSINPVSEQIADGLTEEEAMALNDPTKLVLNVSVTGDVAAAEQAIRQLWGGSLCVSKVAHSGAELQSIADALADLPGMLSLGADPITQRVDVSVVIDNGISEWADATYGPGMVKVTAAMIPVE